jgi:putative DNA primase/helicase
MTDEKIKTVVPMREFERRKAEASRKADRYISKDGGAPSRDVMRVLDELGEMSPVEYGRRRDEIAVRIGTARSFLDKEYKERRKAAKEDSSGEFLRDAEPWPDAVKGTDILAEIRDAANKHAVLPEGGGEVIALWTLFTHCHDCFDISPPLVFNSPTPECGKTVCLTLISYLTPKALMASNISPSAVFRSVDKWHPTLVIDEAETFLGDNEELRGILNSAHNRSGAYVIRVVGDGHEPVRFSTWTPKAVGLIGKLPPTLASRSIHISLKRMLPTDHVSPLREGRTGHLDPLFRKAARWAKDNVNELRKADPTIPKALYGRAADNWRPMFAIADLVGGAWPKQARTIAEKLSGRHSDLAPIMVLEDMLGIFSDKNVEVLKSEEATEALSKMEHRPWPEWKNQKPITTRQLAKLLDHFEIAPKQHCLPDGSNRRGYHINQFDDAQRYLSGPRGNLSAMPLDANETAIFSETMPLEASTALADTKSKKSPNPNGSSGLAAKIPPSGGEKGDSVPNVTVKTDAYISPQLRRALLSGGIPHPVYGSDEFDSLRLPEPALKPVKPT